MKSRAGNVKKATGTKNIPSFIKSLAAELREEREKIRVLNQSITEWEETFRQLDSQVQPEEDDSQPEEKSGPNDQIWKTRYDTQVDVNSHLQSQIEQLRKKILEKKEEIKEVLAGGGIQNMKPSDLKKKIIQLQRQKNNLESQMKDYEWRIDREAEQFHKANEKKKAMFFDIKRNPKPESAQPSHRLKPLPEIKRGTLAKGSYVRKLLERRSSRGIDDGAALHIGESSNSRSTRGAGGGAMTLRSNPRKPPSASLGGPRDSSTSNLADIRVKAAGTELKKRQI